MSLGIDVSYPPGTDTAPVPLKLDIIDSYTVPDNTEITYASIIIQEGKLVLDGRLVGV